MSILKIKKFLDDFFDPSEISEKIDQISIYVDYLLKWNKSINVIARKDEDVVWERHVFDSVQLIKFIPIDQKELSLIDMGSGGGLPGILLAILLPLNIKLIESDERKCIFLKEILRKLDLSNVTVINSRIEHLNPMFEEKKKSDDFLRSFSKKQGFWAQKGSKIAQGEAKIDHMVDVLIGRGLTNLSGLLKYSEALLKKTGFCVFPKGKRYQEEILEAEKEFMFDYQIHPSLSSDDGRILEIRNIKSLKKEVLNL